jgi:deoxyhypusine synthase
MLERYAVKVARTVLRGGSDSNATPLPDLSWKMIACQHSQVHWTARTLRVFCDVSELW